MIPPNQQMQQALAMQRAMGTGQGGGRPEDPLLEALGKQKTMSQMMTQVADHKMKMLKLRMKFSPTAAGVPSQGGGGY